MGMAAISIMRPGPFEQDPKGGSTWNLAPISLVAIEE